MNNHNRKKTSLLEVAVSLCAVTALGVVIFATQTEEISAQSSNFQGGSPVVSQTPDMRNIRILFPAGVRSSWHTHTWGQLLMIEEGIGLAQIRGRAIEEFHVGEPFWTPPGVEHWHGAHPDVDAHQLTIYEGDVEWLDPVTDEQYHGVRVRPVMRSAD
ncbi:MAG: cupin domain-containing protein [Gammaproteobacteria bacterium]|nr:cupin domain-containing protein [Pseudomonadales bacterium]MCP5348069.1 cupin domain-containing protein [Pseudomonadales bacterium]